MLKRTFLYFLNFILFAILVGLSLFIGRAIFDKRGDSEITLNNRLEKIKFQAYPPHAPDSFVWKTADSKDPQSITQTNLDTFINASSGALINNIPLTGKEWITSKTYKTNSEFKKSFDITSYYLKAFQDDGWMSAVEIGNEILKGVAANAQLGNVLSLIKVSKRNLEVIVLAVTLDNTICPCTQQTRIFMSNPISLEKVMQKND